jgi:diaminohydroxyphosphoribosylaminopyrimidine deaminase/5-amino-6-(5-phosphoribosylamino)uracil reductase
MLEDDVKLDEEFMAMALKLAEYGRGQTSPNPIVGAVIVNQGEIVGYGSHLKAGTPHAEIHALNMAGERAKGGTIYVTLEPCSHFGRTPPCADALIQAGVKRVVVGCLDPNPKVSGQGVQKLRDAGIEVDVGVLEMLACRQNEAFFHWVTKRRPFVVWKCASTLDGYIATSASHSFYVTGEEARRDVQRLRREIPAIAVGIHTVLADDPRLTVRLVDPESEVNRQPLRVVFDSRFRLPPHAKLLSQPGKTVVFTTREVSQADVESFQPYLNRGALEIIRVDADERGRASLLHALGHLADMGIHSLLVEGGRTLVSELFKAQLVDKVVYYISPKLLGGGIPALDGLGKRLMSEAVVLKDVRMTQIGEDIRIDGYPSYSSSPAGWIE